MQWRGHFKGQTRSTINRIVAKTPIWSRFAHERLTGLFLFVRQERIALPSTVYQARWWVGGSKHAIINVNPKINSLCLYLCQSCTGSSNQNETKRVIVYGPGSVAAARCREVKPHVTQPSTSQTKAGLCISVLQTLLHCSYDCWQRASVVQGVAAQCGDGHGHGDQLQKNRVTAVPGDHRSDATRPPAAQGDPALTFASKG